MSLVSELSADVPEFSLTNRTLQGKVVSCYDGDTADIVLPLGDQYWKFKCRMLGYNSPEMKPLKTKVGREEEKIAALKSKQAVMSELCDSVDISKMYTNRELDECVGRNRRILQIQCHEFDKYGRVLVTIRRHSSEETINDWMVRNGYAIKYVL